MAGFTLIQVCYVFDFHLYGSFCAGLVSRQGNPYEYACNVTYFIQHIVKIWRNFDVNSYEQHCRHLPAILELTFARNSRYFTIFTKFLMATKLQVFVLVWVTVNAPLVRVSPVWITRNRYSCQCECGLRVGIHLEQFCVQQINWVHSQSSCNSNISGNVVRSCMMTEVSK